MMESQRPAAEREAVAARSCMSCGTALLRESRFCASCGIPLSAAESASTRTPQLAPDRVRDPYGATGQRIFPERRLIGPTDPKLSAYITDRVEDRHQQGRSFKADNNSYKRAAGILMLVVSLVIIGISSTGRPASTPVTAPTTQPAPAATPAPASEWTLLDQWSGGGNHSVSSSFTGLNWRFDWCNVNDGGYLRIDLVREDVEPGRHLTVADTAKAECNTSWFLYDGHEGVFGKFHFEVWSSNDGAWKADVQYKNVP